MHVRDGHNEHGVPVGYFICETCKQPFDVTPAPSPQGRAEWIGCLSDECGSYDPSRDADVLFMSDSEIAETKPVVCIEMLRVRREGGLVVEPAGLD